MQHSLYESIAKLRVLAAVMYDQCSTAEMTEEQKQASIQPLLKQRDQMILKAIQDSPDEVIITIKNIEEDAASDQRKAQRHRDKATEALGHAQTIREALKKHMLDGGHTTWIRGNYMATIVEDKLEIR